MPVTLEYRESRPSHTVDVMDLWLADGDVPDRFTEDPLLLLPYLQRFDCYALLESLNAHLYVGYSIDIDLDVFVMVVSTYIDSPLFTHYLLQRGNKVPMMDIYQRY